LELVTVLEGAETRRILALAARQHGIVTTPQLLAFGWSKDVISLRARRGALRRLHRGVYLVGPLDTPHSRFMAASFVAGSDAVIASYPAVVLFGVRPPREGPIDVIVPRKLRSRPGLRMHQATLHPRDITRRHGIPTTTPARALLDLAATEPTAELERALNEARALHLVSARSLDEQFSRYPRHRGAAALKKATTSDPGFTRSKAERRALELIRRARLPEPEANVKVEGYEVDFLWRQERLIVEIDGYAFHSMRRSFEQDRRRDQQLTTKGYRVIRITWRQLTEEPEAVVATISAALAR
jgi:very-short-patch-repair endonuclease/predicted transcriptional regulator of viral defense system